MNKKGFSPLEIVLALAIFSFLGTILFQSLFNMNKSLLSVTSISSHDTKCLLLQNIWDKELSGAYIPEVKKLDESLDSEIFTVLKKNEDTKKTENNKEEKKEKDIFIKPKKAFFCDTESGNMHLFTFITTNPLAVYNMKKPRTMRVVYQLKPSQDGDNTFSLYRKEIQNIFDLSGLEETGTGKERSFQVVNGIKTLAVEFFAESLPEPEKKQKSDSKKTETKQEKKEKEPRTFIKVQSWDPQEIEKMAEEKKLIKPLPAFIKIIVTFYDPKKELDPQEYIFSPLYGQQKITLEGIKPLEKEEKSEQKETKVSPPSPQLPGKQPPIMRSPQVINQQGPITKGVQK